MIKNLKKAFTIIELVIVIAVIAILAAVMIPTYSSLVDKANQSADIQAVKQMNTILATYVDGSVTNIAEAINALDKDNIDLDDYKPLQKNRYFYFYMDGKTPKVVYTDAKEKAIYPEGVKTEEFDLMSLSGEVATDDSWKSKITSSSVTISSGAQFVDFMIKYEEGSSETNGITTITLDGDIDLKGSTASFGEVKGNITIEGNNKTIKGLRADTNSIEGVWDDEAKSYGFALFNKVPSGKTVKINNLNIENVVIKDTSGSEEAFGHSAVLFGDVYGMVDITDVTISNCDVYGGDKVGAVIGYLTGTASLSNVTVKNTNIYGVGWAASVVGAINYDAKLKIVDVNYDDNVAVGINVDAWSKVWWNTDTSFITGVAIDISEAKAYADDKSNTYLPYGKAKESEVNHFEGITTNDLYWIIPESGWANNLNTFSITVTNYNNESIKMYAPNSGSLSYNID